MINEELKTKMLEKVEEGEFESGDLLEYMELFCQICNESEDVQEEVEDFSCTYQTEVEGIDEDAAKAIVEAVKAMK